MQKEIKAEMIELIPKEQLEKRPTNENVNFQHKMSSCGDVKVLHTLAKDKERFKAKTESKKSENESSTNVLCRAIVDELVALSVKGRQSPIVISIDSDSSDDDEDVESVEQDPLSLSDTEPKRPSTKSKKVSNFCRRNSVISVDVPSPCSTITIFSESEEEDEKPLSNLSRKKKSNKRSKPVNNRIVNWLSELENVNRCYVKLDRNVVSRYIARKGPKLCVKLKRCRVPSKPVELIGNQSPNLKENPISEIKKSEKSLTTTNFSKNVTKGYSAVRTIVDVKSVKTENSKEEERTSKKVSKSDSEIISQPVDIPSVIQTKRPNVNSNAVINRNLGSPAKIVFNGNDAIPTINSANHSFGVHSNKVGLPSNKFGLPSNKFGLPSNKVGLPLNKVGLPSNRVTVPSNKVTVTANKVTVPSNNVGLPSNNIGVPSNNVGLPSNNVGVPSNSVGVSSNHVPSRNVNSQSNRASPKKVVNLTVECPTNNALSKASLTDVSPTEIDALLYITDGKGLTCMI
jgi:hypothetical protein